MKTTNKAHDYEPLMGVSDALQNSMRRCASKSAFLASMLDLIRRNGGLTQKQIGMICKEISYIDPRIEGYQG